MNGEKTLSGTPESLAKIIAKDLEKAKGNKELTKTYVRGFIMNLSVFKMSIYGIILGEDGISLSTSILSYAAKKVYKTEEEINEILDLFSEACENLHDIAGEVKAEA